MTLGKIFIPSLLEDARDCPVRLYEIWEFVDSEDKPLFLIPDITKTLFPVGKSPRLKEGLVKVDADSV